LPKVIKMKIRIPYFFKRFNTFVLLAGLYINSLIANDYTLSSSLSHDLALRPTNVLWSILIPSLEDRTHLLEELTLKLKNQIDLSDSVDKIEILTCIDNYQLSIGTKRNMLLDHSLGKYISFIDDDDDISDDYIAIIIDKLKQNPDCVALIGIISFDGGNPKTFIHSIKYSSYFKRRNTYYRPPNHLNPMKRSIAILERFPEINSKEDTKWAMKLSRRNLFKKEADVDKPYYFYRYGHTKRKPLT